MLLAYAYKLLGPRTSGCCPIAFKKSEQGVLSQASHEDCNRAIQCWCCSGVNFENSNFNVGLPVFTIHGNHDDPAGADNLSAVDVLSTCNLVNYFGKAVSPRSACSTLSSVCTSQASKANQTLGCQIIVSLLITIFLSLLRPA